MGRYRSPVLKMRSRAPAYKRGQVKMPGACGCGIFFAFVDKQGDGTRLCIRINHTKTNHFCRCAIPFGELADLTQIRVLPDQI
jgi:hypothetical protein